MICSGAEVPPVTALTPASLRSIVTAAYFVPGVKTDGDGCQLIITRADGYLWQIKTYEADRHLGFAGGGNLCVPGPCFPNECY